MPTPVPSLQAATARYGAEVKRKLANPAAAGSPEDQLRAPLEHLLMEYDATSRRLAVGTGYVDHVEPAVWAYSVSGKQVVKQWFSYRRKSRERPLIGDRRPPSPVGDIQPERWPHEYTNELVDLRNVLTLVVAMEPGQRELLERICAGPLIGAAEVEVALANSGGASTRARRHDPHQTSLLE